MRCTEMVSPRVVSMPAAAATISARLAMSRLFAASASTATATDWRSTAPGAAVVTSVLLFTALVRSSVVDEYVPSPPVPWGTAMLSGPSTPLAPLPEPVYSSLVVEDARGGTPSPAENCSMVRCVSS